MPIPRTDSITDFEPSSVSMLNKILDDIRIKSPMIRYADTNAVPSTTGVERHEFVVYDDDAGVNRLYLKTGKGNLMFIELRQSETTSATGVLGDGGGISYTYPGPVTIASGDMGGWTITATALTSAGMIIDSTSGINFNNLFFVDANGKVTATSGNIAAWSLSATAFTSAGMVIDSSSGIDFNSVFIVDANGKLTATSGLIGGWAILSTTLTSAGITIDSTNNLIETSDFVSGALGAGWHVGPNTAEFNNIRARGKFTTSVFEKETISVVGGNLLVMDGDVLSTAMTGLDASLLTILGDTTFADDDTLRIKDGVDDEWLVVTSDTAAPTYAVARDKAGDYSPDDNPAWTAGTAVVNYGAKDTGGIYLTSSESNAPYLSVITHAGTAWDTTTTRARLGNLNGFLGYSADLYGIAIGEATKYLKYDPTNGLRIAGTIVVDGSSDVDAGISSAITDRLFTSTTEQTNIEAWIHGSDVTKIDGGSIYASSNIVLGSSGYMRSGQTDYNTGTGWWIGDDSGTPKFSIGDATKRITWDGTKLEVGDVQSPDYVSVTTGFKLSASAGLEINTGTIFGLGVKYQSFVNVGFAQFAGDGSDGNVTISADTDISAAATKQYDDLTIADTKTLTAKNCVIGVKGTLTIVGTISANDGGQPGGPSSGDADGIDGTSEFSSLGSGAGGGGGGAGNEDHGGGDGGDAGGAGGAGGTPASHDAAAGSNVTTQNTTRNADFFRIHHVICGRGAGGGSGGHATATGGVGGAGGGFVYIECDTLDFQSGAVVSANGEDGDNPNHANAGGGGGGGGGTVYIRYKTLTDNSGSTTATGGTGGDGGGVGGVGGVGGTGTTTIEATA